MENNIAYAKLLISLFLDYPNHGFQPRKSFYPCSSGNTVTSKDVTSDHRLFANSWKDSPSVPSLSMLLNLSQQG